jgi:SAM-dependent methyltransferase
VSGTTAGRHGCPVCGAPCELLGSVDFNKSCEEVRGLHLPPAGRTVDYVMCVACNFCFAPEFGAWSAEDFAREIYNDGYGRVDPDHADVRPRANAESLLLTFGERGRGIRHLDYGGGAGLLSRLLRESGWDSTSYDPFFDHGVRPGRLGTFQLITCYEVFEHVADVNGLARNLASLLADDGLILFSTLVSDGELRRHQPVSWWYASPRNGHISLYSASSLNILAGKHGFSMASFSPGMHVFWRRQFPGWARHLLQGG